MSTMDMDGASSDDEVAVSAQKVYQVLQDAWLNEKFSPELLQHKSDYVECMLEQIGVMESNLECVKKTDFRAEAHLMELGRIRYVTTSYLRKRLEKIEQFTYNILEQERQRSPEESYLSDEEKQFATQFLSLNETFFTNLLLQNMPHHFQDFQSSQTSLVPNLSSYVFLRANADVAGVVVENEGVDRDEEIDLQVNSQHLLQYRNISTLLKDGSVQLI